MAFALTVTLAGCSKQNPLADGPATEEDGGVVPNGGSVKTHVFGDGLTWTITKTYPLAQNHHHHVSSIMEIGDKLYMVRTYNTGYQATRMLSLLEGDEFVKIENYWIYEPLYTQDYILTAGAEYTKKTGVSNIITAYYDVKSGKSSVYEQEHTDLESPVSLTYRVQADNDLFLITKYNLDDPAYLWKWDDATKKWMKILDRIPDSENWTIAVGWAKGLDGEFILQTQNRNISAPEENFYVFRDNSFQLLYKRTGQEHYMGIDGARIVAFDNRYLFVGDGAIKEITSPTTTKVYKAALTEDGLTVLSAQVHGNFLFIVEGNIQSNVPIVTHTKAYNLETNTLYTFSGLPTGPEQPGGWYFMPTDGGLDIILNKNVGVYATVGGNMAFDTYRYTSNFDWE